MPFDGNGVYTPPAPEFPAVADTVISSADYNAVINDIADAFDNCITRDGQGSPSANIPWNGYRLTTLGTPTQAKDAVNRSYMTLTLTNALQSYARLDGGTFTGTMAGLTMVAGDNSTKLATTAFVANQAFTASLPDQSGNSGKIVTTNGTTASWVTVAAAANGQAMSLGALTVTSLNMGQTTLNYYGEGTWTPSLGGTATYTDRSATYTRVGRMCTFDCKMTINAIGTGSATTVSGYPFTNGSVDTSGSIALWQNIVASYVYLAPHMSAFSATSIFGGIGAAGASLSIPVSVFTSSTVVRFSLTSAYVT